jgi:hypothetical protein
VIEKVLQDHLSRYPALQILDLYKLLHQAALGSEHAVSDRGSAERWLSGELAEMGKGMPEPLIDPISHDGELVRIHLQPYIATRNDPMLLLDAFIRTANEYHGDPQFLEQYWQEAVAISSFSASKMDDFFQELKEKNFRLSITLQNMKDSTGLPTG